MKKLLLLATATICLFSACKELTEEERAAKELDRVYKKVNKMYKKAGEEWITTLKALEMTDAECWGMFTDEDNSVRAGELGLAEKHVEEANRILGGQYFRIKDTSFSTDTHYVYYDDRFDGYTARDIFTIYNSVHNPKYDKNVAVLILRPNANSRYKTCFSIHWDSYNKVP